MPIGFFFGAVLAIFAYNLLLLFSFRDVNYLYLMGILTCLVLFFADQAGFTRIFIWQQFVPGGLVSIAFLLLILWACSFLQVKTRLPKLHSASYLFIAVWGGLICILPFLSTRTMSILVSIWMVLTLVFIILAAVLCWTKENHRSVIFLLIACLGLIFGGLVFTLSGLGILPGNLGYAYSLGFVWMALFGSFALADRSHQISVEIESSLQKIAGQKEQILEGLPFGVSIYDQDRKMTFLNQHGIQIFNHQNGMGQPVIPSTRPTLEEVSQWFNFRVASTRQAYPLDRIPITQAFQGKTAMADDLEIGLIPVEMWANPIFDPHGKVESVVAAFHDISQRKKNTADLVKYQDHLERLVAERTSQLSILNAQLQTEVTERNRLENGLILHLEWLVAVNLASQAVLHSADIPSIYQTLTAIIRKIFRPADVFIAEMDQDRQEIIIRTHSIRDVLRPDWKDLVVSSSADNQFNRFLMRGKHTTYSIEQFDKLGGEFSSYMKLSDFPSVLIAPLRFQDKVVGVVGLAFNAADTRFSAYENTLFISVCSDIMQVEENARLFEQTKELIAADERSRLARDLHDSVTQVLFAASLVAEVIPKIWHRDQAMAERSLDELVNLTRGALAEMRTMLIELRPATLAKTPLNDLITQLAQATTSRVGLPFQLFIEQISPNPDDVHIVFYRIAQESLNNVIKHAAASHVELRLTETPIEDDESFPGKHELKLIVRDNGCGFEIEEAKTGKLGLTIMRERAASIGASLSVVSKPGAGTRVTLTWQSN